MVTEGIGMEMSLIAILIKRRSTAVKSMIIRIMTERMIMTGSTMIITEIITNDEHTIPNRVPAKQ